MEPVYTAILLAAGRSSRMGELKGLLPWKGRTLLEYQLEQLKKSRIKDVVVVLGHEAKLLDPLVQPFEEKMVLNPIYEHGKSSSIRKGVSEVKETPKGILVTAVDQPVPYKLLDQLITAHEKTDSSITVPVYKGRRGHPVLFSGRLLMALSEVTEETLGLRRIMKKYCHDVTEVNVTNPSIHFNFNTIAAYKKATGEVNKFE